MKDMLESNRIAIYYNVFYITLRKTEMIRTSGRTNTLPKEDDFGFDVTGVITISLYEYDHLPLSPKMGITAQTQQMFTSMGQNTGSISFVSKSLMRFSSSSYCYYF